MSVKRKVTTPDGAATFIASPPLTGHVMVCLEAEPTCVSALLTPVKYAHRKVLIMQIREHAQAHPDKPAVIMYPSGTTVTFGQLEARANQLAHFFRRNGVREGDAVAILMENNEHYHAVMWAARRSGLYYVPINTHLTAAEAAYIIDNSSAKAIIGSAALRKVLEGLAAELPNGLPDVLVTADDDLDGWWHYPECVADEPDTPIDDEIEGDLLQYSSGTTGRPKGIKRELTHMPPAEVPGMMSALVSFWLDPEAIYL